MSHCAKNAGEEELWGAPDLSQEHERRTRSPKEEVNGARFGGRAH
jgi:hypothetical protein